MRDGQIGQVASKRRDWNPLMPPMVREPGALRQGPKVFTASAAEECAAQSFPSSSWPAPLPRSCSISFQRQPCHEVYLPKRFCSAVRSDTEGDTLAAPANKASYEHSTKLSVLSSLSFFFLVAACQLGHAREQVSDRQTDPCFLSRCEQVRPDQLRGRDIRSIPPERHT